MTTPLGPMWGEVFTRGDVFTQADYLGNKDRRGEHWRGEVASESGQQNHQWHPPPEIEILSGFFLGGELFSW